MCHDRWTGAQASNAFCVMGSLSQNILGFALLCMCGSATHLNPTPGRGARWSARRAWAPASRFTLPQLMCLFIHTIVTTRPALCNDRSCVLYFKPGDGWRCHGDDSIPPRTPFTLSSRVYDEKRLFTCVCASLRGWRVRVRVGGWGKYGVQEKEEVCVGQQWCLFWWLPGRLSDPSSFSPLSPTPPTPLLLSHTHLHKPTSMTDPHMHSSKTAWRSTLHSVSAAGRRHRGGGGEGGGGGLSACSAMLSSHWRQQAPRSSPAAESSCSDLFMKPSYCCCCRYFDSSIFFRDAARATHIPRPQASLIP